MIAVIFNPTARGDKATSFRARLNLAVRAAQAAGKKVVLKPTRSAGDAVVQARNSVNEGFESIVAAGGDGTVNEVVNGIAQVTDGPDRTRLAILPLGTVNVFAKEMLVPTDFEASWKLVAQGNECRVDLALATYSGPNPNQQVRRWFVQMGGAGLDSIALERVSWALKKKVGPMAYVWAGVQALLSTLPMIEAEVDGRQLQGQLALIGNGKYYGGRWVVFPSAKLDDGLLDLAIVDRISPLRFPIQFAALARGRFAAAPGLTHCQGREIRLRPPRRECPANPFHVEGDNVGWLPAHFGLDLRKLRVVVP